MADNVTTQIESKTRVSRHINLSSLYFIVGYLMFAYMLKDFIYSLFFVPYMIFSLCCAVYLVLPSRYNKGRANWESIVVLLRADRPYTGPMRSRRWTMLDSMRAEAAKTATGCPWPADLLHHLPAGQSAFLFNRYFYAEALQGCRDRTHRHRAGAGRIYPDHHLLGLGGEGQGLRDHLRGEGSVSKSRAGIYLPFPLRRQPLPL